MSFISETVMTGFKTGVALHLASTQLPKLFGFKGAHGDFWERMGHFFSHLPETNPASLALGARGARACFSSGKKLLPNRPVALLVVVAGIAAVPMFGLAARGVALLGAVPQGLPVPGLPPVHSSDLNRAPAPGHGVLPARRRWRRRPSDGRSRASTATASTATRSSSPWPGATSPPGSGTGFR